MASVAALKKSRDAWVKKERDYKAKAAEAHRKHKALEKQIAAALAAPKVAPPMKHIITDSWGYHPGVHDGVDLICPASEPLFAICRSKVVRAAASGWWNNGAPADPALKARGDGIIILESLVDAGPIRKGMHLCYGHAEHATVKVGQVVEAGQRIGDAGFANAWHVHFMVNDDAPVNGLYRGVGDRDPRPILDFVRA